MEGIIQGNSVIANRFEVIRVLGAGASSRVCLVHDKETNQEVALKVLVNRQAFEETTIDRFIKEFEICRSIRHPNIVEAYDLIETGNSIAFTVEFVDGTDLGRLIDERSVSLEEIDSIMLQLLSALETLHEQHITHRDIKPENLILRRDHVLKVADFGLMKQLDQPNLTKTGIVVGTAQYMPPEYIKTGEYDERGDIYAAGMVLYELLSGKRRLRSKRATEIFQHLDATEFQIPAIMLQGLPRYYVHIIQKALAPDPAERYQTVTAMKRALMARDMVEKDPTPIEEQLTPRIEWGLKNSKAKTKAKRTNKRFWANVILTVISASLAVAVLALSWPHLTKLTSSPSQREKIPGGRR